MSESNNSPSDALQRTLGEILAAEPILEGRNSQQLQSTVESVLNDLVADPQLKAKLLSETRVGFGMSLGKFLAWKVWTDIEKADKRKSASKVRPDSITIRLPQTVLEQVKEGWPSIRAAFMERVGFSLSEPTLAPDAHDGWALEIRGGLLAREELPEQNWQEPLLEFLLNQAPNLLTLGLVKELVDEVRAESPVVAEELERLRIPMTTIYRVLDGLLEEGVSIREMETILTAIALAWDQGPDRSALLSAARTALSPWICRDLQAKPGVLRALRVGRRIEEMFIESIRYVGSEQLFALDLQQKAMVVVLIKQALAQLDQPGPLVLLTNNRLRKELHTILRAELPDLTVLSEPEIHRGCKLEILAVIDFKHPPRGDVQLSDDDFDDGVSLF
ncbi:MAG: FHIPEP family type III secretion protein [Candidatus Eremiobacteraeota bacterium]|nr:FHIPEP family type III secretion protein [Candidatus Eremiobacteraeota bacterium]